MQECICLCCSKVFLGRLAQIKRGRSKFCSRSCGMTFNNLRRSPLIREKIRNSLKKKMVGIKNPNWKGGISKNYYHYKKLQIKRYPERVEARVIASREVRAGRLIKQPCEFCKDKKTVKHHDDYSKPLEVRWMCRPCHRLYHKKLGTKNQ